LTDLWFAALR